jgi:hypothetical protein
MIHICNILAGIGVFYLIMLGLGLLMFFVSAINSNNHG